MLPTIYIFSIEVNTYGICSAIGILLMGLVACLLSKKRDIPFEETLIGTIFSLIGALIGAHLLFGITNTKYIINTFSDFINSKSDFSQLLNDLALCFGGMVFYGGLLGAFAFGAIYCKIRKLNIGDFSDCFAPAVPLFHVFGRIGCFLSGCCYGIESDFGFTATDSIVESCNNVNRFPVQLLESSLNLIIFFILLILFRKGILKRALIFMYLLLYSVVRFFDEFLRADTYRGIWLGLSTSQWISLVLFVISLIILIKYRKNKGKNKIIHNKY